MAGRLLRIITRASGILWERRGDGWFLLRLSVHDPIMPLNIESDAVGGVKLIAGKLYDYVKTVENVDISALEKNPVRN